MDMDDTDDEMEVDPEHVRIMVAELLGSEMAKYQAALNAHIDECVTSTVKTETPTMQQFLASNLDECFSKCKADLDALPSKLDAQIVAAVTPKIDEVRRELNTRCDSLKMDIMAVDTRVDLQDKLLREMQEQIKQLQSALAVANSTTPAPRPAAGSDTFTRDTDETIIQVFAGKLVAKSAVHDVLAPWVEESGVTSEQWELTATDPLSKFFTIQLKGAVGLAARRVQKLLASLRVGNTWREFNVEAHAWGQARLHLSQDKNAKQIKTEVIDRKLRSKFVELYGASQRVFFDRDRGWLSLRWDALCKLECLPGREPTRVLWNPGTISKYSVPKDRLVDAVKDIIEPGRGPEWCL
ncbi:unnamed protein product [Prorocentrum cordatum]|uniref:Uncharacterized protein n=1 Tax=Prorocentrum cordatum TaxID=2364126 RepID=A0ABN9WA01_9DINO|nr:unnamed protein product [Polarella glacialis]